MEPSPQILLVNRSIIVDNDRMLLLQRSLQDRHNPGLWEFPGGKIDPDEDMETGSKREILEETGLVIESTSELSYVDTMMISSGRYEGRLYVALFRTAVLLSGDVVISDEDGSYSWDTLEEAVRRDLSPESRRAVEAFRRSKLL